MIKGVKQNNKRIAQRIIGLASSSFEAEKKPKTITNDYILQMKKKAKLKIFDEEKNITKKDFQKALSELSEYCTSRLCDDPEYGICEYLKIKDNGVKAYKKCVLNGDAPCNWLIEEDALNSSFTKESLMNHIENIYVYCKTLSGCSDCDCKVDSSSVPAKCFFELVIPQYITFDPEDDAQYKMLFKLLSTRTTEDGREYFED